MAHFAKVVDGIVENVLVAESAEWCSKAFGGTWIQTSFNTYAGKHRTGGTPLHKNYAGLGYHFDGIGFYAPQPFPSWIFNENTYIWEPPTPMPNDGKMYKWIEEDLSWQILD